MRILRERLVATIEEYESSTEETKAANEELQSINEEYRSSTEELETSKEELQSINEELQTVNNELNNKLDEISRAKSDLENLMAATKIATLFLDRELRIQRYTPGMEALINVMAADRGRPVSHLTHKLAYDKLVDDANSVLRNLVPIEREVPGENGQWFLLRLRPYRTVDDRIDGVVVTFVEITQLKRAEKELRELNETLEKRVLERTHALDETNRKLGQTRDLFYTLFHANPIPTALSRMEDGTLLDVNEAYLRYFGFQREDVLGRSDQGLNRWLELDTRSELITQLREKGSVRNFEMNVTHSSGETVSVLISTQRVEVDGTQSLISAFIDITERVQAERQNRLLASELAVAEQRERQRISQLLHDDLQQRIYAVQVQLSLLRDAYQKDDQEALLADFAELDRWLAEAVSITRHLSIDLNPPILRGEGLAQAIYWLASQMQEQYKLEVTVQVNSSLPELEYSLQVILYQAVRELLFNVVKHAGVLQAVVTLDQSGDHVRISVMDKGEGFNSSAMPNDRQNAQGLLNIRNRLNPLGCRLDVASQPGGGTLVRIDIPYSPSAGG